MHSALGEGENYSKAMKMLASEVCAPERERETQELERWRPICVAALDFKRADKNGGRPLGKDLDFSFLGKRGISCFEE